MPNIPFIIKTQRYILHLIMYFNKYNASNETQSFSAYCLG